jgi:hypothetical protein
MLSNLARHSGMEPEFPNKKFQEPPSPQLCESKLSRSVRLAGFLIKIGVLNLVSFSIHFLYFRA